MELTEYEKRRLNYRDTLAKFTEDEFGQGTSVSYNFKTDRYHIYFPEGLENVKKTIQRMIKQLEILRDFTFSNLGLEKKNQELKKQQNDAQVELSTLRKEIIDANEFLKKQVEKCDIEKQLKTQMIDKVSFAVSEIDVCKFISDRIDKGYEEDFKKLFRNKVIPKVDELNQYISKTKQTINTFVKKIMLDAETHIKENLKKKEEKTKKEEPDKI